MTSVINMPATSGQDTADGAAPAAPDERGRPSHTHSGLRSHAHARSHSDPHPHPHSHAPHSPFVPLLLGALALLGWLGYQTHLLLVERSALQAAHASQQQTVDSAGKLRLSLDALAADTQRMAEAGNPNAKLLVDELRKRGITINAAATGGNRSAAAK